MSRETSIADRSVSALKRILDKNWPEVKATLRGGMPRFVFARRPSELGANVPVFCYHEVEGESFAADLRFLARNDYVTIGADALLDHLEQRNRPPDRAVVLTFDDGSRNLHEVVFPALRKFHMRAVAFVAPRFHQEASDNRAGNLRRQVRLPLDWAQIREMEASGVIEFQSHTYEHRYVPRWPEPAELLGSDAKFVRAQRGEPMSMAEDFRRAKEELERRLERPVRHLAFPRYDGTSEAVRIGQAVGYTAFWRGVSPNRPGNRAGESPEFVVRLDGRFLRRLPGSDRQPLARVLRARYSGSAQRLRKAYQADDLPGKC